MKSDLRFAIFLPAREFAATTAAGMSTPVSFVPPRTLLKDHAPSVILNSLSNPSMEDEPEPDETLDLDEDVEITGMGDFSGRLTRNLVVPGQLVTDDPQFMR